MLDERLSAETGIDRHHQHQVHILDYIHQRRNRGGRIDGNSGLHPCIVYALHHTMEMRTSLLMDVHYFGTKIANLRNPFVRLDNHQVDVERLLTTLGHSLHHGKAERDVGYENAVHHIKMEIVGFR